MQPLQPNTTLQGGKMLTVAPASAPSITRGYSIRNKDKDKVGRSVLLYLNSEDEEMRNLFHDVRREVGLDFIVPAKAASTICRLVPI